MSFLLPFLFHYYTDPKFLCDCRKQGNWKCGCLRKFSDPDANYGWDSSREKYYYGRNLFMVSASESPYDLPIYPRLFRANKHDSVLLVSTYHELLHWYPEWRIGESILDSAFDAYPIYEMLEQYDVSTIIDLNPRRSKQFTYNEMDINLDGVPICPLGRKMIDWGVEKNVTVASGVVPQPLENGNAQIHVLILVMVEHFIHQLRIILGFFHV